MQYQCLYFSYAFTSKSHFDLGEHELKYRHEKRYCPDRDRRRDETGQGKYNRQTSDL